MWKHCICSHCYYLCEVCVVMHDLHMFLICSLTHHSQSRVTFPRSCTWSWYCFHQIIYLEVPIVYWILLFIDLMHIRLIWKEHQLKKYLHELSVVHSLDLWMMWGGSAHWRGYHAWASRWSRVIQDGIPRKSLLINQ